METGADGDGAADESQPSVPITATDNSLDLPDHPPAGLTPLEYSALRPVIEAHHTYHASAGQCSSLLSQRTSAPPDAVWSIVRRFDRPQVYKHFIRSCSLKDDGSGGGGGEIRVGCLREVVVISGLPASTSTERLDVLDDVNRVTGFTIIGGEHRLRNYRSVTTVNEVSDGGSGGGVERIWTLFLESYIVDVPEGNTEEDTRLFADTVVRLNLQKLASVSEGIAASAAAAAATAPPNRQ